MHDKYSTEVHSDIQDGDFDEDSGLHQGGVMHSRHVLYILDMLCSTF